MDLITNMIKIYVQLLDEGTDVCRPVDARLVNDSVYEIVPLSNYDSLDEEWEFPPGSFVRCKNKLSDGKQILVAHEKVES